LCVYDELAVVFLSVCGTLVMHSRLPGSRLLAVEM